MMKSLVCLWLFCCTVSCGIASPRAGSPPFHATDTLVIPFEYKQSAIFHKYTLDVLDSVVKILNDNKAITVSLQGYAYIDEGNDTICKYLSLDRALFIRDALLGRGIDSVRITDVTGMGQWKPEKRGKYKVNNSVHCRVELLLIYPPPPVPPVIADRDGDGIPDEQDACPDDFGYPETNGCPLKDVYYVYFDRNNYNISDHGFSMADIVVNLLRNNPGYTISIYGHASKEEVAEDRAQHFSTDREEIIYRYFLSRNIPAARMELKPSYGSSRPVNAQRNLQEIHENSCAEILVDKHLE